jgi:hypothetical protein
VLHLLEEVAVVDEESGGSALCNVGVQDANGEVGFADAYGAGEEEAGSAGFERVAFDKFFRSEMGCAEGAVGGGEFRLVVVEEAILIAAGDVGLGEELFGATADAAVAGLHEALAVFAEDEAEAEVVADGAGFGHELL